MQKIRLMGSHGNEDKEGRRVHIVVVPTPTQGHINPLLQFSKHLAHRGLTVTFLAVFTNVATIDLPASVTLQQVSVLPYDGTDAETPKAIWERIQTSIRLHLIELIARHENDSDRVACVVYDSMLPWIHDVVKELGVLPAVFFTQSFCVNAIYYNVHKEWINVPLQQSSVCLDHGFPVLQPYDLPSFIFDPSKYPFLLSLVTDQFSRLNDGDWIFINTFDSLEPQEGEWMRRQLSFKSIGPMLPSFYLDGTLQDDRYYGLSLLESNTDSTKSWLDSKDDSSVVYVSFGSMAEVKKEQIEELAWGLKLSNKFFLWVVRESEIHKLPPSFMEETTEKGLIVKWCPQVQVLAHRSVGCFVTHCGWNSTLEALCLGVAMVAMELWSDQPTNAKYVEDVWRIGKRMRIGEDGICRREEIEMCVNEVMGEEDGNEIRENLRKLREMAKEAMDEGGTSNININHFVQQLMRKT
ncbi:UDP-glycosyltransferase 74E2-like [Cucurbita moschata]|uniref:Mogroside I-E synthase n=1 Tax=Cucurbita moschata TaxID=3662 RepID=A0A6J1HJ92_CUCMO|nr:UDP-glycosyltransferase 74E2-like [Cucurbita moschata]